MLEREYRELSFVTRWSLLRRIRNQSIAEHSYYVALYSLQIAKLVKWPDAFPGTAGGLGDLLQAALYHDLGEVVSGDPPGPVHRRAILNADHWHKEIALGVKRRFGEGVTEEWRAANNPQSNIGLEIKSIVKVADSLDALFYLLTEQQMGNGTVRGVVAQERRRLFKAIDTMGKVLRLDINELVTSMSEVIHDHENESSLIPDEDGL